MHSHPIQMLLQFIAPGNIKVWTKHGVSISDVRGINRVVFYHVVSYHVFEVSIRWMANHYLGLARNFGCRDLFLGEPFIFLWFLRRTRTFGGGSMYGRPNSFLLN